MAENSRPAETAAESAPPTAWELRRSRGGRVVAGVCAGLGRHTDIDPLVYRVAFAMLTIAFGLGVWLYLLAWLLMPGEYAAASPVERIVGRRIEPQVVFPLFLAALIFFLAISLITGGIERLLLLAVLLVGVLAARAHGVDVLAIIRTAPGRFHWRQRVPRQQPRRRPYPQSYPQPYGPYAAPGTPAPWWSAPTTHQPMPPPGTYYPPPPGPFPGPPPGLATGPPPGPPPGLATRPLPGPATGPHPGAAPGPTPKPAPPRPPRRQRERSFLTPLTLVAAAAVAGLLTLLDGLGAMNAPLPLILAAALVTIGLGLAVGTWYGRGPMLVVSGFAVAVALVAATINIDALDPGAFGDVTWRPTSAVEAARPHEIGAGDGTLVLTALPPRRAAYDVDASVAAGGLRVVIPPEATVRVDAYIGSGAVRVPGRTPISPPRTEGGTLIHTQYVIQPASDGAGDPREQDANAGGGAPRIDLTLRVGTGDAVVVRAPT